MCRFILPARFPTSSWTCTHIAVSVQRNSTRAARKSSMAIGMAYSAGVDARAHAAPDSDDALEPFLSSRQSALTPLAAPPAQLQQQWRSE